MHLVSSLFFSNISLLRIACFDSSVLLQEVRTWWLLTCPSLFPHGPSLLGSLGSMGNAHWAPFVGPVAPTALPGTEESEAHPALGSKCCVSPPREAWALGCLSGGATSLGCFPLSIKFTCGALKMTNVWSSNPVPGYLPKWVEKWGRHKNLHTDVQSSLFIIHS